MPTISKPIVIDNSTTNNATTSTRKHTVKQGDNISSIAQKYGVSVDAIKAINPNLTNVDLIFVGQVIVIP